MPGKVPAMKAWSDIRARSNEVVGLTAWITTGNDHSDNADNTDTVVRQEEQRDELVETYKPPKPKIIEIDIFSRSGSRSLDISKTGSTTT